MLYRIPLCIALAGATVALTHPALAFHDGGVASCEGCHVSHEVDGGQAGTVLSGIGPGLKGATPSEVCLACHKDEFGSVLGDSPTAPPPELGAGNFTHLFEDNLNDAEDGLLEPIPGDAAGHNIVAPAYGLSRDPRYSIAPGGTFPADEMGCTACHDPHGSSSFRMLRGEGEFWEDLYSFVAPAPDAEGLALDSAARESPEIHSAYRSGMNDWCANCHGRYHEMDASGFQHPVGGVFDGEHLDQYNRYQGASDPDGGLPSSSYLPEVPFEDELAAIDATAGPGNSSSVICLSCHRAHATSAPAGLRWDPNVTLLDQDGTVSGSYPIPNPYGDPSQGTLCAKCHPGGSPATDLAPEDGFLDALFGR